MTRIFTFGSNREGRHGAGAALDALHHHGAVYGQAEGLQGSSYAIVTKELRRGKPPVTLEEIRAGVERFMALARRHPELGFEVTALGCGRAGFRVADVAPLFASAPVNVHLPTVFLEVLERRRAAEVAPEAMLHGIEP